MARITVYEFAIDLSTEEHIWGHQITPEDLACVIERGEYVVVANRSDRRATHILFGLDAHGQCLAVPILETSTHGIWEVVTAWACKGGERTRLMRSLGR